MLRSFIRIDMHLQALAGADANEPTHFRCWPILLQKSKVASVEIFSETLKREPVDDSDNLSRASEVAYEFCMRR
jgi:hypothetical protein